MTGPNHQARLSKEEIDSVISLYSNGEYQKAIDRIKSLNKVYPNVPLLFNLVGACYKALGQLEASVKMFETAVNIKPDYAEAHNNLGNAFKDLGRFDDAVNSYQKAIEIKPEFAEAHNNLGNAFKDLGRFDDAVNSYQKAIEIKPEFAEAHNNLGNAFKDLGRFDDAVNSYQKAIEIKPEFAEAHNNLGSALKDLGRFDDAVNEYQKAIDIKPEFAEAHNNLGNTLKDMGRLDDSIKYYKNAISLKHDYYDAYTNLGFAFMNLGRCSEAIVSFERAISINAQNAEAYHYLGNALNIIGKINAGVKCYEKAIEINPIFAEVYYSLGNVFRKLKKRKKAHLCYEKAIAIKPNLDFLYGTYLNNKMNLCVWNDFSEQILELKRKINNFEKAIGPFSLLGLIDDPVIQKKASEIFINYHYPANYSLPKIEQYPKHQKIRIGYFSGDFKIHPVAYLTAELYEVHNRDHFEIHAFSFGKSTNDEMNLRIKAGVDHFHDVDLLSHKEIVELSRSLEIDIAVDLGGFSGNSRPSVFAMSAAPIQLSYIGYLGTMGADYYDYLIADPIMIPKENQKHYVEKIVYLPCFQVNDSTELPPKINLTRQDLGLPAKGFIFCCFNNTYKFTPTTFDSWSRILKQVEGSVLLLYIENKSAKLNLINEIRQRDIKPERLIFCDRLKRPKYLARYRTADLFLDTQPYNAGTTASDALRMGLPIVTIKGKSFNSREASSILNSMNLPELITNTAEEYESLAIELAKNPDKLKAIKDKLEANLSTAPLYNTKLFAKSIETAYTKMYERHHQGLEPDHIYVE